MRTRAQACVRWSKYTTLIVNLFVISGRSLVNPFMRGVVVGSKAFSNVTRNFSKLNPMNKLKNSSQTTLKSEGIFWVLYQCRMCCYVLSSAIARRRVHHQIVLLPHFQEMAKHIAMNRIALNCPANSCNIIVSN